MNPNWRDEEAEIKIEKVYEKFMKTIYELMDFALLPRFLNIVVIVKLE